jgi:formiminotetrahydrofolate cyclodeaminase
MNGLDKLKEFINLVDSDTATPGGGSVSALVGSFGCALARMYGHLSVNKKAFLSLEEDVREEFVKNLNELNKIKDLLFELIEHDSNVYQELMNAFKLPKSSDEEIEIRKAKIKESSLKVTDSPLKMMEVAFTGLVCASKLYGLGNKNALSDLIVGIYLLEASIKGAYQNVKINLSSLDEDKVRYYETKSEEILKEASAIISKLNPSL